MSAGRVASWYESPQTETGTWAYRVALSIDPAAAGGAAVDVSIAVPKDWDHFWDNIQSGALDVRVVLSDGKTKATYQLEAGYTYATRTLTIGVDDVTMSPDDTILCLWLYYGNATATDGAGSFTLTTPKTAFLLLEGPGVPRLTASPARPGATKPDQELSKTTDETMFVWLRVDGLVSRRLRQSGGKTGRECVVYAGYVVELATVAQASMVDNDTIRFLETPSGAFWIRFTIKAGTTAVNYTFSPLIYTSTDTSASVAADQILNPRALVKVRDVAE